MTKYKILIDPNNFESFVQENTRIGNGPLQKRRLSRLEVEDRWTKEEFIKEMSKWGYTTPAEYYVKYQNLFHAVRRKIRRGLRL